MVNEEIITALKNSVDHGESLESAMQVLISSGYNAAEVNEASRFIGGVMTQHQTRPEEELTMPSEKRGFFKKKLVPSEIRAPQLQQGPQTSQAPQQQSLPTQQSSQQIKENIAPQNILPQKYIPNNNSPFANSLTKIGPPKTSHVKEIALLMILLVLIGVLILTIVFREHILKLFSG
jgi:hypothetical protein